MMIVETPGEFPETGFVDQLDWLAFGMADISRSTLYGAAQYFPEEVQAAQDSLAEYAGRIMAGGIMYNQYYVAEGDRYVPARLPAYRHATNDFVGILQDLQDIAVTAPSFSRYSTGGGRVLCLEIEPFGDEPAGRLEGFYEARRNHPFASEEHVGKPIWVPVRPLLKRTIDFPQLTPLNR
ncbi:MAG: hypothetical protein ACREGB_02745 [Candidatus Saccharimonadales bacterium]